jgi:hypothetical protein
MLIAIEKLFHNRIANAEEDERTKLSPDLLVS